MPASSTTGPIDVLIASSAGTPGLRRADEELALMLGSLGLRVRVASGKRGLLIRLTPMPMFVSDLLQALRVSRFVHAAVRRHEVRSCVYPSTLSAVFEPTARLRRAGVRFDAQAIDNRPGARNVLQRLLERRVVREAGLLLPYAIRPNPHRRHMPPGKPAISLPRAVTAGPPHLGPRRRAALIYAGNPHKKGLDLAAAAMCGLEAGLPFLVVGIDAAAGRRFLAGRNVAEPPGTEWLGHVPEPEFRRLTSSCETFISSSRYEDFGAAQLEALMDGCIIAALPSRGPIECLGILRQIDPDLIGTEPTPAGLRQALTTAMGLTEETRARYRTQARELLEPYSEAELHRRLSRLVVPRLLELGTG